jgi:DNA invertase Pin-like site-specific DNA recombinase
MTEPNRAFCYTRVSTDQQSTKAQEAEHVRRRPIQLPVAQVLHFYYTWLFFAVGEDPKCE